MAKTILIPNRRRQFLRSAMAATLPRRLFVVQGPTTSGSVSLTFDDGPHPVHTPRLLDVLKDDAVSATFFVVGQQAERHPELVRRIAEEGHLVGHHSYSHGDPAQTSARQLMDEVRRTIDFLGAILGKAPTFFRPPHGKLTAAKLWGLWRSGQTVVLWNVDPKDFACRSSAEVSGWFQRRPLRGGDIVLMHDTRPHAANALPVLIRETRGRGLGFSTLVDRAN